MLNEDDHVISVAIGIGVGAILLCPWLVLAVGAYCGWKWFKDWRFNRTRKADKRFFINGCDPYWLMYLGSDGDIRWWYYNGYFYPQAIDNGTVYWDQKIEVKDRVLLEHLRGFYNMGNEWPDYYRSIHRQMENIVKEKKKKRKNEVVARPSDLPRADYADAKSGTKKTVTATGDAPLMNLIKTVQDLEKDAKGSCPTIDFGVLSAHDS